MPINWTEYDPAPFFDEIISTPGYARAPARKLVSYLRSLADEEILARKQAAEVTIKAMGVSFTVYTEGSNIDRDWPFDIIPRVIALKEWRNIEAGLKQRIEAINIFINDLYNDQRILTESVIPREIIEGSPHFLSQCQGIMPPYSAWANISGTDLVRDKDGSIYVLEDNLRVPSGVSYMIENRQVTKRVFPELFAEQSILPIDDYPLMLFEMLASLSPRPLEFPEIVVLTPGIYNSAYFEHSFLAQQIGSEIVEGQDLFVDDDDRVYMRTVDGATRVDVIYRRIDDVFMDPEVFRKDSVLGVPGLMRAWKKGQVAIANAPGSGVADDKVIYAYVPKIVRYYLDQDPILPNVPTYLCADPKQRDHVLKNIDRLVVKPANESGGYGMMIGPFATKKQHADFKKLIQENPRNYIAQPTLALSTAPALSNGGVEPRHLDLRPFILQGRELAVTSGGLTRVAMRKGSLVVNSSQGGGSKDTWVVDTGT